MRNSGAPGRRRPIPHLPKYRRSDGLCERLADPLFRTGTVNDALASTRKTEPRIPNRVQVSSHEYAVRIRQALTVSPDSLSWSDRQHTSSGPRRSILASEPCPADPSADGLVRGVVVDVDIGPRPASVPHSEELVRIDRTEQVRVGVGPNP